MTVIIDPTTLTSHQKHRLFLSALIPRPVAWVSSVSPEGVANLAPFSFCGGISSDPPLLYIAVGRRRGALKDTAANILATGEFVVHICHRGLAEQMVASSADYPSEVDEFEAVGLAKAASEAVAVPRLAEAKLAMECRLVKSLELGRGPVALLIGEVVRFHLDPGVLGEPEEGVPGLVDAAALDPVARLGSFCYATLGELFEIKRPRL